MNAHIFLHGHQIKFKFPTQIVGAQIYWILAHKILEIIIKAYA